MPNIDPITAFFGFAKEAMQATREWMAGSPTRRMKRAIEYGERFILESWPILEKTLTSKEDRKILEKLRDIKQDFFKNN